MMANEQNRIVTSLQPRLRLRVCRSGVKLLKGNVSAFRVSWRRMLKICGLRREAIVPKSCRLLVLQGVGRQ